MILVDPDVLQGYDGEKNVRRVFREEYQHEQLVNRSDDVVPLVMIGGKVAWENKCFSEDLGQKAYGRLLRSEISKNLNQQINA